MFFIVYSAVSVCMSDAGDLLDDDSLYESVNHSPNLQTVRLWRDMYVYCVYVVKQCLFLSLLMQW